MNVFVAATAVAGICDAQCTRTLHSEKSCKGCGGTMHTLKTGGSPCQIKSPGCHSGNPAGYIVDVKKPS